MIRFITGRVAMAVPVLFLVATLAFWITQVGAPDPAETALGVDATPAALEAKRAELGTDRPLVEQYRTWIVDAVKGNLGTNWFNGEAVGTEVVSRLPTTTALAGGGLAIAVIVGTGMGLVAALFADRWIDRVITVVTSAGLAVPNFWIALLFAYYLGVQWRWLPAVWPAGGPDSLGSWVKSLALPCVALGLPGSAAIARQTRSSVLGVLQRDHVRTALAKGLPPSLVIRHHVLRNAAIPVVTTVAFQASALIGGSLFVEFIFNVPGLGSYGVEAILRGNTPAVLGFVIVIAVVVVAVNTVLDLSYAWLNPKVRLP